jgi:hypothetical protein
MTAHPSSEPTANPSNQPTASPTHLSSSLKPTNPPSTSPSHQPSASPSLSSTASPSSIPTFQPTSSLSLTASPSSSPSVSPSASPTEQPSSSPSASPTTQPSSFPSLEQSSPSASVVFLNAYTGKLIGIKEGLCSNGNAVELQQNDRLAWQQWFRNQDNTIESVHCPGMVIDIERNGYGSGLLRQLEADGSSCDQGLLITISAKIKGRDSQMWKLNEDGFVESMKCSNMGIDIRGFGENIGAHIHLWTATGAWNQAWSIEPSTAPPSKAPNCHCEPTEPIRQRNLLEKPFDSRLRSGMNVQEAQKVRCRGDHMSYLHVLLNLNTILPPFRVINS